MSKDGFLIWFTGLSGAGKSTLAARLTQRLTELGVHVECLDGDEVRQHLSWGLGFSRDDRDRNVRRIGYVARMLARSGACAITAAISPYQGIRDEIRAQTDHFIEVYCECPIEVLTERDPKGLYERALAGEIKNFTGIDDPYEAPQEPEVHLRTDKMTPDECIDVIVQKLTSEGLLEAQGENVPHLHRPYGGELLLAQLADSWPAEAAQLELDDETLGMVRLLAAGFFSPLFGFMSQREARKVEDSGALERGLAWPAPLVLPAPEAHELEEGQVVELVHGGRPVARYHVQQLWAAPSGEPRVAGRLVVMARDFALPTTPRDVRGTAREHGWHRLGAMFCQEGPSDLLLSHLAGGLAFCDAVALLVPEAIHAPWAEALAELPAVVLVPVPPQLFANEGLAPIAAANLGAFESTVLT